MPYKDKERQKLAIRGCTRSERHGNWRQTYIDCGGQCIAQINGTTDPCGQVDFLELHEIWGESKDPAVGKFQQRVMLCNRHHALVDDGYHQYTFIQGQYQQSRLAWDVDTEMTLAGGLDKWVEKYKLDNSRWGCLLGAGLVKVEDVVDEIIEEVVSDP